MGTTPELDPQRAIFINCPYDADYEPLADALFFTIVYCGFWPRAATDSGTTSDPRMERIFGGIHGSKFSIHDLSRYQGEGERVLARFNMPLELGIAMGWRYTDKKQHDWLVLVPKNAPYAKFVSDLAGYDPPTYDGTPQTLIPAVMAWLATRPGGVNGATPPEVVEKLEKFRTAKAALSATWSANIPWPDLVRTAAEVAQA
jgi:hypothetical protein